MKVIVLMLFSLATALLAKDVAFTLMGNSNSDMRGIEYSNSVLTANDCLNKDGWETKVLTSSLGNDPTLNIELTKNGIEVFDPRKVDERFLDIDEIKFDPKNLQSFKDKMDAYLKDSEQRYLDEIVSSL